MRLKGKAALITGAGSGIGRATALAFAAEGARLFLADIRGEAAEETARLAAREGGEGHARPTDVSNPPDVRQMVEECVKRLGRLDILVNNAGIEAVGPVVGTTEADLEKVVRVNLQGVYLGCKYGLPQLIQGGGGAIVNTASVTGIFGTPLLSAYSATKGGVVALTRAVAMEAAPFRVRVNCVCPGFIDTPMTGRFLRTADARKRAAALHPLGRTGKPEEVARAILFLASDDSSFITGVALPVDGGMSAGVGLQGQLF